MGETVNMCEGSQKVHASSYKSWGLTYSMVTKVNKLYCIFERF